MLTLLWMLGCDRPEAPPVSEPEPAGELVAVKQEVLRADGRRTLRVSQHETIAVDGFDELTDDQKWVVVQVVNTVGGPCAPCLDDGVTLADCLVAAPPACDTVGPVAARVVRMAGEGLDKDTVHQAVEYADAWYPVAQPVEGKLDFAVWLDDSDISRQARERFDELDASCPGLLQRRELSEKPESVRSAPTVFIDGYRLRGLQSPSAYRRLIDMELADRGLSCPG